MSEKRFFCIINKNGRLIIIDKECHTELFDMTLTCEVLNRLDLKLKTYNEQLGEQQATISALKEENEQLKQSNDRFADTVAKQVSLLIELRKENEQLRQIIKDIVCATDETYTKNTSMFKVTVVFDGKMYNQIRSCLYE